MTPRSIQNIKHYRRHTDLRTQRKFYRPLYKGVELMVREVPPEFWQYNTATEAQEHALRNIRKKRRQIARFQDAEYRKEVMVRYAGYMLAAEEALERREKR